MVTKWPFSQGLSVFSLPTRLNGGGWARYMCQSDVWPVCLVWGDILCAFLLVSAVSAASPL
jgi:hypothetical protein